MYINSLFNPNQFFAAALGGLQPLFKSLAIDLNNYVVTNNRLNLFFCDCQLFPLSELDVSFFNLVLRTPPFPEITLELLAPLD